MPDTKISAAADIASLTATDMMPVARSGSSTAYHATMAEVSTYANTNLPAASTTVPGVVKVDGSTITISSGTISGAAASPVVPAMDGGASVGIATGWSRGDHIHPTDTTRAPLASPTFTGSPAAPTPTTGDSSTKLATTAFVQAQMVASGAGVSTFNTRAGSVVLLQSDLAALGEYNDTGRNRLHNPAFSINQRSYTSGTALAAAAYGHDRWKAGSGGCTYTFTQNQPFTTITITAGSLQQVIEAMNVEGGTYTLSWTGTAQGRVGAGSYAASPVTVTGLAVNTATTVEFNAGTLGRVQFEPGSVATTPTKRDPQQELALCQRFYEVINITRDFAAPPPATPITYMIRSYKFAVTKRATPSIQFYNLTYYSGGSVAAMPSPTMYDVSTDMVACGSSALTNAEGFVAGQVWASADL